MTGTEPSGLVADVAAATVVVGTTVAELTAFLADPPPWERAHLTAIAWVVDEARTAVLLVEHRVHGWSCAGGHVEPGEHPRDAAARELAEETGIVATPSAQPFVLAASSGCARAVDARHWALGYLFTVDPAVDLRTEPGQPARWFPVDHLPSPRAPDIDPVLTHLAPAPRR